MNRFFFIQIQKNFKSIKLLVLCIFCLLLIRCKEEEPPKAENKINWISIKQDINLDLLSLSFIDKDTGCILAYVDSLKKQRILYTDNGGKSFSEIGSTFNGYITNVFAIGNNSFILQTDTLNYFHYENDSLLIPTPYFLQSNDLGGTWTPTNFRHSNSLFIISRNKFFTMKDSILNISIDRGRTWKPVLGLIGYYFDFSISFISENVGFIAYRNSDYNCLKTTDGGLNWKQEMLKEPENGSIVQIQFINEDTWCCISNNQLLRSLNKGKNWTPIKPRSDYSISYNQLSFHFINVVEGDFFNGNKIYHTSNGGNSWTIEYTTQKPAYAQIKSWTYTSTGAAYAITDIGGIIRKIQY